MTSKTAGRVSAPVLVVAALGSAALLRNADAQPPRELKIAMIAKSEANFVFLSARKGAEDAAAALSKRHGAKIDVLWRTPQTEDAQKQAENVATAAKERVGAILIACSDEKVL